MPYKDIIFTEYLPDRGGIPFPRDPGYLIQASNVRPTVAGYRPITIDEQVASASTISATPLSAAGFAVTNPSRHYAGTATALYESSDAGVTWYDNSRGGYTSTSNWDFELFNRYVIATNGVDVPQYKFIDAAVGDNFDDLGGNPPVASVCGRIRDHLFLGRLFTNQYAVQWSSIGNPESFPNLGSSTALANQSGFKELPRDLGVVAQIVGGEKFGLVFQTGGITRFTYIGGNVVYQADTFERARSTSGFRSAIMVNNYCYFLSMLGAFRTDGHIVESLSTGKIDDAVIRDILSLAEGEDLKFGWGVAYDSRTNTVMWSGFSGSSSYVLCYHIDYQRFSTITRAAGTPLSPMYSVRDANGIVEVPYGFNSTPRLVSFTDSTAVPVTLRTGFFELTPSGYAQITGLELLGDGSSVSLAARSLAGLSTVDVANSGYTAASSPLRSNLYRIRQSGKYHSIRLTDTSGASDLYQGVRVHFERASDL